MRVKASEEAIKRVVGMSKRVQKTYGFEYDGIRILAPKTGKDIITEGKKLHHCVGHYLERVDEKTCIILFIRKAEAVNKPYVTMEINPQKRRVIQVRGLQNHAPDEEVMRAVAKWKEKMHYEAA